LVVHRHDPNAGINDIVTLDATDGRQVGRIALGAHDSLTATVPDGKTLLVFAPHTGGVAALWAWLAQCGLPGLRPAEPGMDLLDAATGRRLLSLPDAIVAYAPDGQSLAACDPTGRLTLWDVPPQKPLAWFAAAAALLVLPVAWLARRRVRWLQSVAGARP
jgi:hypothetical protein